VNISTFVAAGLASAGAIAAARFTLERLCGFSDRTAKDVVPFLRKIDMDAVYGTFHPSVEAEYKDRLSPRDFRVWQWKRFHLAIHYCTDVAHNCWLFLGWIRFERHANWDALPPELQKGIQELRVASLQCRMASFMVRTRLRLYLLRMALLPFLEPPKFGTLFKKGSSDMIDFYEAAKFLAESFSLAYGEQFHQEFLAAL
jgi:hypothetical protein